MTAKCDGQRRNSLGHRRGDSGAMRQKQPLVFGRSYLVTRTPRPKVAAFLAQRVGFLDVARVVEDVLTASTALAGPVESLQQVYAADRETRQQAEEAVRRHALTN